MLPRYIAIKCLYRERRYIAINLLSYREINVHGRKQRYIEIKITCMDVNKDIQK